MIYLCTPFQQRPFEGLTATLWSAPRVNFCVAPTLPQGTRTSGSIADPASDDMHCLFATLVTVPSALAVNCYVETGGEAQLAVTTPIGFAA